MRACVRTASLALVFALLGPAGALADADVEEGLRLAQGAAFEEALAAFDRAEQGRLTRAGLIRLLEGRALVYEGMGDEEARDLQLLALVSVAPEHNMGRELPPRLSAALDAVRADASGGIRVIVAASPISGGVHLSARVEGDVADVVRGVRVSTRREGGAFSPAGGPEVSVPVPAGGSVDYHAVALGPGDAPVATAGSVESPLSWSASATAAVGEPGAADGDGTRSPAPAPLPLVGGRDSTRPDAEGGSGIWPWVVAGGLVAAAVTIALVLLVPSSDTAPNIPTHSL